MEALGAGVWRGGGVGFDFVLDGVLPPVQWVIDLATAGLLFLILGKRWAILPGLITEAIPGMGIFPVWVLVVASIAVYDDIHKPHRKLQRVIEKISR